jgi:hypothetical protein
MHLTEGLRIDKYITIRYSMVFISSPKLAPFLIIVLRSTIVRTNAHQTDNSAEPPGIGEIPFNRTLRILKGDG